MVTRRVRSEYMKRFREPRWDSFSRCYEDCVRYRLSRRVMEATHLPWGWEPYSSSSSGCSTPRGGAGGVQDPEEEVVNRMMELRTSSPEPSEEGPRGGPEPVVNGFHGDTDNGPMDSISSSDGEVLFPRRPRPLQRPLQAEAKPQRGPRKTSEQKTSEQKTNEQKTSERKTSEQKTSEQKTNEQKTSERKTSERKTSERKTSERKTRAKSQPPSRTRDQDQSRLDWTQRHNTPNNTLTSDPRVQTGHMRRSRSAELHRKKQTLSVTYDPWVTEYMHCYSARV